MGRAELCWPANAQRVGETLCILWFITWFVYNMLYIRLKLAGSSHILTELMDAQWRTALICVTQDVGCASCMCDWGIRYFRDAHLAASGLTLRPLVWPWQQVCVKAVREGGVRATWIFIMTSPDYCLECGKLAREEEGGRLLIAHNFMLDIKKSAGSIQLARWRWWCSTKSHGFSVER